MRRSAPVFSVPPFERPGAPGFPIPNAAPINAAAPAGVPAGALAGAPASSPAAAPAAAGGASPTGAAAAAGAAKSPSVDCQINRLLVASGTIETKLTLKDLAPLVASYVPVLRVHDQR
jgi:hypothetical protein